MEAPKYPNSTGSERELLEAHIEFCRQTIIYKVSGVTKTDGIKRLGPTATSVLGLLRHLTEVEYWWFQDRFTGVAYTDSRSSEAEPDGEFMIADGDTVDSLLQGYKDACENSRNISLGKSLDDVAMHPRQSDNMQPSLRWIYLHLIDETARHAGHLDIYRELLDGAHDGLAVS
ncbi:MAG: DinB family protein [Actinomycetes bacterium]